MSGISAYAVAIKISREGALAVDQGGYRPVHDAPEEKRYQHLQYFHQETDLADIRRTEQEAGIPSRNHKGQRRARQQDQRRSHTAALFVLEVPEPIERMSEDITAIPDLPDQPEPLSQPASPGLLMSIGADFNRAEPSFQEEQNQ